MATPLSISDAAICARSAPGFQATSAFAPLHWWQSRVFHGGTTWSPRSTLGAVYWDTQNGPRANEAVITFRGSDTGNRFRRDVLLIDFAAAFGSSPKGYAVHGGFSTAFRNCKDELDRIVRALPWHIDTLHICGHSMGGALATLAAERFLDARFQVFLYTFGAPRVGGVAHTRYLKKKLKGRLFRYYYTGDPVTWFPMFPYVHLPGTRLVASSKWIGGHNDYWRSHNQTIARDSDNEDAWMLEKAYQWMRSSGTEPHVYRWLTIGLHKILQAFGFVLGSVLFTGATVVDQIVATLSYLLQWKEKEARPLLVRWLAGAFNALGKIFTGIGDTISSIIEKLRYALNLLVSKLRIELNRPENIPAEAQQPEPRRLVRNTPHAPVRFTRL